jgi:CRP/FNR family transcriptional regulator, cyclic AMP receptor protein
MVKTPSTRCSLCRTRSSGPFCRLGGGALDSLPSAIGVHNFKRGQVIFYAGSPASALYIVRSGRIRVYRTWQDGEDLTLRLLGPGEIIGYRPLFAAELSRASAEAMVDSSVCIIPGDTVRDLVSAVPGLATLLLEKMAQELRISEDLMMDLLHLPVRQRAARLLLDLLQNRQGSSEPGTIPARELKRKDMARMIGTTPETFSRVLHVFAQAGIVSLARDCVRIRNSVLLKRIAGESPGVT